MNACKYQVLCHMVATLTVLLFAANAEAEENSGRMVATLSHTGDVFGEGDSWDKQYAREALEIFKSLKPDPAWTARLEALPNNTWLKCSPKGEQKPEGGRAEVPMIYLPDINACLFTCGCNEPGYSSDTWLYKTGANQWVQMWPNWIKGSRAKHLNKGPYPKDRPAGRCSLGLAYDIDRKKVVLHGGANTGRGGLITWEYDPFTNDWDSVAPREAGFQRAEDNCLGFAPGFGVVEIGGDRRIAEAPTWVYRPSRARWEGISTQGSPPGGHNSRMVWASKQKRLVYWSYRTDQLWTFDPESSVWEDISPKQGPKPVGFYRQGMAYDSANDVVLMYGSKSENNNSQGPWVFSFETGLWKDMNPQGGRSSKGQQMLVCYDSEYNVMVLKGSDTWVYRYKQADKQ